MNMGAREGNTTPGSGFPDPSGTSRSRQRSPRAPSRFHSPDEMVLEEAGIGASVEAALPRQTCKVHGCFRPRTSGHVICSFHLRLGQLA